MLIKQVIFFTIFVMLSKSRSLPLYLYWGTICDMINLFLIVINQFSLFLS